VPPEGKRHLPIVTGGAAPPSEPDDVREWHWAGLAALLVTAISILFFPLVLWLALGSGHGGPDLADRLHRLSPARAQAALVRIAVGSAVASALAALASGAVAGRFKRARSSGEPIVGMLFAALVWALVARRAWAVFVFAPPMALSAWVGVRLGWAWRRRTESPRPQETPG